MFKGNQLIWIMTFFFLLAGSAALAGHGPGDAAGPPAGGGWPGPEHALGPGPGVPPSPPPGAPCDGDPAGIAPERGGYIHANRHVLHPGDPFRLRLCLPETVRDLIDAEEAELSLIILGPVTEIAILLDKPLPEDGWLDVIEGTVPETLEGPYQVALVLVVPGTEGQAIFDVRNWYGGWRGLLAVSRIKFAPGEDPEDLDGDGEVDLDSTGNGFPDSSPE